MDSKSKSEKIALFRYGLIASLVIEPLPRGELTRRAREIAERELNIPLSNRRSVSVDTLLDWVLRYRTGGLEALAPKPRSDRGQTRVITSKLADTIERHTLGLNLGLVVDLFGDGGGVDGGDTKHQGENHQHSA